MSHSDSESLASYNQVHQSDFNIDEWINPPTASPSPSLDNSLPLAGLASTSTSITAASQSSLEKMQYTQVHIHTPANSHVTLQLSAEDAALLLEAHSHPNFIAKLRSVAKDVDAHEILAEFLKKGMNILPRPAEVITKAALSEMCPSWTLADCSSLTQLGMIDFYSLGSEHFGAKANEVSKFLKLSTINRAYITQYAMILARLGLHEHVPEGKATFFLSVR
jgi:hypothetical protein